ncbi:MAG: calcium/sodium antiporter [Synechococcales cyanobacterium RU_4_20]|nr:calcium/sodium antiporter [Synechococcales cyanobacterium RU_4_20]NJR67878.1 calcium/sodium antiporter [Synechococcales cyanobacterium CRU_2_2]
MSLVTIVLLVMGLVLLVVGAEALVRGASNLASSLGISPLIIGLTVVAYGTSAPELAVSIQSSLAGQIDIAVGNVVGSNIFNVLFILGLSAIVAPLVVAQQLIRIDVPVMIGVSILTLVLGSDGTLGLGDGLLLTAGAIAYTLLQIVQARQEKDDSVRQEYEQEYGPDDRATQSKGWKLWLTNLGLIFGGVALLIAGSHFLVDSAIAIAQALGVSELVIGLTIVAAGTSLPELATSVVATLKGERDIAVGNVVGSNVFNILAVLGLASLTSPVGLAVSTPAVRFDIPVMIAVAIACLPIFFTGSVISRWEGFVFVAYYISYIAFLGLRAMQHGSLDVFSNVMLLFVIPLTMVTLFAVGLNKWRSSRRSASP